VHKFVEKVCLKKVSKSKKERREGAALSIFAGAFRLIHD
jgi:hypothetical protein